MAHLNGWQRLWVLVSVFYVVPVAIVAYLELPGKDLSHSDAFYTQLSSASLEKLSISGGKNRIVDPDDIGTERKMPNGHILQFRKGVTNEQVSMVAREYYALVDHATSVKRIRVVGYAFLIWLLPCIGLYLFGHSVGWVYRGFRKDKSAP